MTIYDPTALRRELHEMPELALNEKRPSAYVAEKLKALGIETHENVGGSTGVVGIIRGAEPGPVFMLRADMDALRVGTYSSAHGMGRALDAGRRHCCRLRTLFMADYSGFPSVTHPKFL